LKNPEVGKFLNPDVARRVGIDVAVGQGQAAAENDRKAKKVSGWTQRLGRDLTPQEVAKIESLPEKKDMTIADQIVEYELVTGKPAPPEVVDSFYKIEGQKTSSGGQFGNSLQGRALDFVTNNAVAYANGMLDPQQARIFEASATEAYKPVTRQNPANGLMETLQPTIPNFVTQALQQGGRVYGGTSLTSRSGSYLIGPEGQIPKFRPGDQVTIEGRTATVGPDGFFATGDLGQPTAAAAPQASGAPSTPSGERTIWDRRRSIAGPVAAATAGVNRVPFVGPLIAGGLMGEEETRKTEEDRRFVENASRDLVRILQNNPRFAEGEREAIEKEISIGPEAFRSQKSYEAKLIGIAQSLSARKRDAQAALAGEISLEERKRNMDNIQGIDNFMRNLGLPVVVTTEEQVQALPPGTVFMDEKGNEFRKR
jgi:hypothetical protein